MVFWSVAVFPTNPWTMHQLLCNFLLLVTWSLLIVIATCDSEARLEPTRAGRPPWPGFSPRGQSRGRGSSGRGAAPVTDPTLRNVISSSSPRTRCTVASEAGSDFNYGPTNGSTISNVSTRHKPVRPKKRLPSAIIIGVKKAGTRALLEYLRLHPKVRAPGPEIHFFDRYYFLGLNWYRKQMPATCLDEITIEKTPKYFIAKHTPERIYKMNPNTKLIVVVRDPVTRALSDYAQNASKRPRMPSFEQMAFMGGRDPGSVVVNQSWHAISIGLYHKHVKRWLKYFPLEQMHFVSGEKLITNPVKEANLVEDFLGLDRMISPANFYAVRRSGKNFPCPRKHRKQPKCLGSTKGRTHPVIPGHLLRALHSFYRTPNHQFYRLVDRDFQWQ